MRRLQTACWPPFRSRFFNRVLVEIQRDVDLQGRNTLAVPSRAELFCALSDHQSILEVRAWIKSKQAPWAILGAGSNVLLPEFLEGVVLSFTLGGWLVKKEDPKFVWVQVNPGQNWHEFVSACVHNGWYGIENLALIPGTVGAAPIQNIGAYGVEVESVVESVQWFDMASGQVRTLDHNACAFSYRDSVFKSQLVGAGLVTGVVFKLKRQFSPVLIYPALKSRFDGKSKVVTASQVFETVCQIRREKLPDPEQVPNCGSFFKNPVVTQCEYAELKKQYADIPCFATGFPDKVKVPAAWLIEQAGWKGVARYGVGVHRDHALVLINPQRKSLRQVHLLANQIVDSVSGLFRIQLEPEPQELVARQTD